MNLEAGSGERPAARPHLPAWPTGPVNATRAAHVNRARVLSEIRINAPLSRAELVRSSGLTPASISNVVRDLVGLRLVLPTGKSVARPDRTPGAPAALLGLDGGWHRVLAVHQGVSRLTVGATDLAGQVLASRSLPVISKEAWVDTLRRLAAGLQGLVREEGWRTDQVRGVGVAAVGLVDAQRGVVRAAPNLGWEEVPMRAALENQLPWPVRIRNNVHAMAFGEHFQGRLPEANALYVYLGTGVGAGILLHGEVQDGAHGAAGEIGHVVVPGGGRCTCGKHGCLETVVSEPVLARLAEAADGDLQSGYHKAVVIRLVQRALGGDPAARRIVYDAGDRLGHALAQVAEICDPAVVVLNGTVTDAGDLFLAPLAEALRRNTFTARARPVEVRRSAVSSQAGLIGAAALALDAFVFNPDASLIAEAQPGWSLPA